MASVLQIELQDADILAALDRAIEQLQSPGELFRGIGEKLETNIEGRFQSKTDPAGNAWAPLTPGTIEIYESEWFKSRPENDVFRPGIPGSLLERTRQLRQSLAFNAGADYLEIGTSRLVGRPEARQWQVGTLMEWGTNKMVPRRILTADPKAGRLGPDDQADVLAIVNRWLGDAFA